MCWSENCDVVVLEEILFAYEGNIEEVVKQE